MAVHWGGRGYGHTSRWTASASGGTPPPTFPSGAALLLYGSDASATSPLWKNRAAGSEVPVNLVGTARPMENPHLATTTNNVTRTASVAGVDGALKAVRYQYVSGSTPLGRIVQRRLPAGTYTMQVDAIDNSGSGSVIRIGGSGSSHQSGNKNVGGSWATYTHTFTLASATTVGIEICGAATPTAFDVTIDNVAIVIGSSPITVASGVDPHAVITPTVIGPNKSGNVVEATGAILSTARVALGLPEAQRSAVSFVAAVRMDPASAETSGTIFPILNEVESASELNSANGLIFGQYVGGFRLSGTSSSGVDTLSAGAQKAGWCILVATAGAAGTDLWVNKVKVASKATAYTGGTFNAVEILGLRNGLATQFPGKLAVLGMWERKLSDAEVAAAYAAAVEQVTAQGETFTDYNSFLIGEGDSITAGSGDGGSLGGYLPRAGRLFTSRLQSIRYAVPGASLIASPTDGTNYINTVTRMAAVDAKIAEVVALGKRAIFSVLIGANSTTQFNSDPTPYFDLLKTYTDGRKALGAKIVVQTMTAQSGLTGTQYTNIDVFNQMLRDGVTSGFFDACVDHDATAMGTWSGTNFADTVHPNATGHALMATTFEAAVAPLVI